jgi:SNF2 family DNA or RNA helicase
MALFEQWSFIVRSDFFFSFLPADDINSLLSFLGVEPLNDSNVFRRAITQPIQNGEEMGLTRLRTTMACIALRRSKALANLKITAKTVSLLSVEFPEGFHKRVHDCLFATARAIFEAHLHEGEGEALKNYTSIFETLLRIRQSCCSARLVPKARRDSAEQVLRELQNRGGKPLTCEEGKALMEKLRGAFESEEAARVPECSICLEEMDEDAAIILRSCLHIFCASCIGKVNVDYNAKCPLCRHSFQKTDMIKKSAASAAATAENGDPASMSVEDDDIGISPKVAALLEAIKEMKPDEKGVIFSQFTSFLDIVGHAMQAAGHSFTRIDGSKRAGDRIKAISDFNTDDDGPRFILCSLHAAGTGINLTRGSWAFMLDTWWNES